MQTILISGAYGFVGTNLSNSFKDKYNLWALDIHRHPQCNYSKYYSWDDLDTLPWDEVDTIIHLAGKAHDTKNSSKSHVYFEVNTGLTEKIFNKFLSSKAKQFIFFSSVKAAVDKVEGEILTENVVPQPVGPYGESKIKAEQYIRSQVIPENQFNQEKKAIDQFQFSGDKKVYILRPCMIHGPGNKGNLNLLYNVVKKGIPYPLGSYDNKRSFLNIWNLSWIVEQLIVKSPESGIYHLADDEPISTNLLIEMIAKSQKKKTKIWKFNKRFINRIAKIGNILYLPLNTARLQKLTENYVVSNDKIKEALGTRKLPVDVISGLRKTLDTFSTQ